MRCDTLFFVFNSVLVFSAVLSRSACPPNAKNTEALDQDDIQLLEDDEKVAQMIEDADREETVRILDCIVGKSRCNTLGRKIKDTILPEILENKCCRCTAGQKENASKFIRKMQKDFAEEYAQILALYQQGK